MGLLGRRRVQDDRPRGRRTTKPAFVAKLGPDTGTLSAPAMCPTKKLSDGRTSRTVASPGSDSSTSGAGAPRNGPRFSSTIRSMFGGRGVSIEAESATNSSTVASASAGLNRRSKPIVVDALRAHALATQRARDVPGVDLDAVRELQQAMQAVEQTLGALVGLDRQVGPRSVADEQRVPGQQEPRLLGACPVGDRETAVLGPVPRRVNHVQPHAADVDRLPVGERFEGYAGSREGVDRDGHAVLEREAPVSGDVVRVRVGLQDADDPHVAPRRLLEVLLDRVCGVDDDGIAGFLVADQVGRAAEIVVDELREQHSAAQASRLEAELLGDHHALHLVGALADLEHLLVAVEP